MTFYVYPSTEQFRRTVRSMKKQYRDNQLPTITFQGTVKLHGTNAAIVSHKDGTLTIQSRGRVLSAESDNAGFADFVLRNKEAVNKFVKDVKSALNLPEGDVVLFGEWCGGNIQQNVAITGLNKMFVLFQVDVHSKDTTPAIYTDLSDVVSPENLPVFNIFDFGTYSMDVDFNEPEQAIPKLIAKTEEVEKECPAGKFFGKSGIGEGIVWRGFHEGNYYFFKVKGEKHASSKVKTLTAVDIERINSIKEFADYVLTESRLNQGLENVPTLEIEQIGTFIRWVVNDIAKEELDTIQGNGFTQKEINPVVSKKAKDWFIAKLNEV